MKKQILILAALALMASGCKQADTAGTFTDSRDGKKYKTVKIGNQVWMAENLNYEAKGSKCYGDDPANCEKYGRLYDWETAMKICPAGWHLPSDAEWDVLMVAVGGVKDEDGDWQGAGKKLKSTSGWNNNGNGTDEFGFPALPGGIGYSDGSFDYAGNYGYWWSATQDAASFAWSRGMGYDYEYVGRNDSYKSLLFAVRCVQDTDEQTAAEKDDGVLISRNGELVSETEETVKHESDRVPKGYRHFDAIRGDLNGDGTDDYVLIVKGTDKKNIVKDENSGEPVDRNRRGIMIFFNNGGGDHQLALQNLKCFSSENEDAGGYFPPELSVSVKKGNLYIAYNHGRYGSWTYTFRYRDGEFVMIGFDDYSRDSPGADEHGREIEVIEVNKSVNLLTQKALTKSVTHYADGEDKTREEWMGVVVKKLVKLKDIEDFQEWDKQYTIASPEMISVEGGSFMMGSSDGGDDEKPVHRVKVSAFRIGKYEVTQKEYFEVMGVNPSEFKGDNLPVEHVSWFDAVKYCNRRSEKEGLTPVYRGEGDSITADWSANGYRLPTEAEWEYAAKGGNEGKLNYTYSGSNNAGAVAWYKDNSNDRTHPVGTKAANELGLHDMSGNVLEWVWDWYGDYTSDAQRDPSGTVSGAYRVLRGGSWIGYEHTLRSGYRGYDRPANRDNHIGFRVVRR